MRYTPALLFIMADFYTLPQGVGASLLVPLGEDQGLLSRLLQLFHDRGYELRGEDAESVGSVCVHNNHENPEGCEVMSSDMHPTRGTRIHPKGLQSPLEGHRHPTETQGQIRAPFAGTICSTSFLKPLLFEHGREALNQVHGSGIPRTSPLRRSKKFAPRSSHLAC